MKHLVILILVLIGSIYLFGYFKVLDEHGNIVKEWNGPLAHVQYDFMQREKEKLNEKQNGIRESITSR